MVRIPVSGGEFALNAGSAHVRRYPGLSRPLADVDRRSHTYPIAVIPARCRYETGQCARSGMFENSAWGKRHD